MTGPVTATVPEGGRVWLRRLSVRDFRNIARLDLASPPDGFAVVGENGHGKTNLLEAIYYLQLFRSFRGARDHELVRFGADAFHVGAEMSGGRESEAGHWSAGPARIGAGFERAGRGLGEPRRKRITVDGVECNRLSDAIGAVPSVIFAPADVALLAGPPAGRRRFLDVVLALTSRTYLRALQLYRGALARRNAALRGGAANAEDQAAVWEPTLAEHGATIWRERLRWSAAYAALFSDLCSAIGEPGETGLRYASIIDESHDLTAALAEALEGRRRVDLARGATHVGPHRDDLVITLEGRELRAYGSAGQHRTAAVALRLLEAATLRQGIGVEPMILLDDPFAELDEMRATRMLELLVSPRVRCQTILVVPRARDIPRELTELERWTIRHGELSK